MENNHYPWGHPKRYNDFSTWFRGKFSERVQKVSIDAGFTCPNRDGSRGRGGCTYCNNNTFKPGYCDTKSPVTIQLEEGIDFFGKKYESMLYIAYFQAYTNTYKPLSELQKIYEEALRHPKIMGIVVSTRPDCVNEEILDYFAELSKRVYVMLEFGVESHLNHTLKQINRGHTFEESVEALKKSAIRGLNTCAHLILGLPGECYSDWLEQARAVSELPINSLKLHQLQIHRHTVMEKQYLKNPENFHLFTAEEYTELVVDYLERLNPAIIVERFVSQAPAEYVVAPNWGLKNFEFTAKVERRLKERDTWQGKFALVNKA